MGQRQAFQEQAEREQGEQHVPFHRIQDRLAQLGLDLEIDADHRIQQGPPCVALSFVLEVDAPGGADPLAEDMGVGDDRLPVGRHALGRERRPHHLLKLRVRLEAGRGQAGRWNEIERCLGVIGLEIGFLFDEDLMDQFRAEDRATLFGRDIEEDDVPVFRMELVHEIGMPLEPLAEILKLAPLRTGREGRSCGVGPVHGLSIHLHG